MPNFIPENLGPFPGPRGMDCLVYQQAGLLASGRPTDRAFPSICRTVAIAAFVTGYSGGPATDSHRLPSSRLVGRLATQTQIIYGSPAQVKIRVLVSGLSPVQIAAVAVSNMALCVVTGYDRATKNDDSCKLCSKIPMSGVCCQRRNTIR
jgi:hypothetical protein